LLGILAFRQSERHSRILFSPIVLGELMFGFRNGKWFKKNMDELNNFFDHEKDGELHYPLCSNIHPVIYDL
jgi:hypothetical protein